METLKQRLSRRLREMMRDSITLNTQTRLADKSGISQSSVQRILSGEQTATLDVLEALSLAFGVRKAQHFLLEREEVRLLSLYDQCDEETRGSLLGFLTVAAVTRPAGGLSLDDLTSRQRVSPELFAAVMRAQGVPTNQPERTNTKQNQGNVTPPNQTRKRGRRSG